MVRGVSEKGEVILWWKAIPTTEAAKAQDAQQNAQWRVDNCVCSKPTGTRKSKQGKPAHKKSRCKREEIRSSYSTCMLSLPWKEIVPSLPMDLLRTPRKNVSGAKKSCCGRRYESTPCKLGGSSLKIVTSRVLLHCCQVILRGSGLNSFQHYRIQWSSFGWW